MHTEIVTCHKIKTGGGMGKLWKFIKKLGKSMLIWVVLVGVIIGIGAYSIYAPIEKTLQKETPSNITATTNLKSTDQKPDQKEESPSASGYLFAFVILFVTLVTVGIASKGSGFGDTLKQPAYAAFIGIVVLNALAFIFAHTSWCWFWDHQILFWGSNMSFILFAFFISRPEKHFKLLSYVIAGFIIFGFVNTISSENKNSNGNTKPETAVSDRSYPLTVEAPVGTFSEKTTVPLGFDVRWGESQDSFIVMNDRGLEARYDKANGIFENLATPSQWIKFKSLGDKVAIAKLRFSKMN